MIPSLTALRLRSGSDNQLISSIYSATNLTFPPCRLLVVRLLSPLQPCQLASLAGALEESAGRHWVTVLLQRRRETPHHVLVAALPSRDLSWEMSRLRLRGYDDLTETSAEISMGEGEQLVLRFSGNITSAGGFSGQNHQDTHFRSSSHMYYQCLCLVGQMRKVSPLLPFLGPVFSNCVC